MKWIGRDRHLNLHCLAAMSAEDTWNYNRVKTAILRWYNINKVTHYHFSHFCTRSLNLTSNLCVFFCSPDKAMEWVVDMVMMEQFLDALPPDVQIYVYKFKSSKEAGQLVDGHTQARR